MLHVLAEQEKNRIEHYVPLHPSVIDTISEVLAHDFDETDDSKLFFMFNSFQNCDRTTENPAFACSGRKQGTYVVK